MNEYVREAQRVGSEVSKEITEAVLTQCNAVVERAEANIREISAQTKAVLSPDKISEAAIAVATPEKIATELSKHILVTRPAQRGETKNVFVTRLATRDELREQKQ